MKKKLNSLSELGGLVYSTDKGRICPQCGQPVSECRCGREEKVPEGDGIVRLRRETKGRKGKGVTLVTGVLLPESELKKLAKELKTRCGVGGSVKDGVIELQGDQRDLLLEELARRGFRVRKAGG